MNQVQPPLLVITLLNSIWKKTDFLPENVKIKLTHTVNDLNSAFSSTKTSNLLKKISFLAPENS